MLWLVLAACRLCPGQPMVTPPSPRDSTTGVAGAAGSDLAGAAQAMWSAAVAAVNKHEWEEVRGYLGQLRQLRATDGLSEALATNVDAGIKTLLDFMAKNDIDVELNPDVSWCTAAGGGEGSEYCSVLDDMAAGYGRRHHRRRRHTCERHHRRRSCQRRCLRRDHRELLLPPPLPNFTRPSIP